MIPTITAFANSPDGGDGQARDTRVRWAFEEVGLPYDVRLVTFKQMKEPAHMSLQPFGQIPTFEQDGLALFESGSIILHIAEQAPGLLPADPDARARAITWMFATASSIEPVIVDRETTYFLERDQPWYEQRFAMVIERIHDRLRLLAARLGDAEWLDGDFSAGDLLMISALRRIEDTDILDAHPNLKAYMQRGMARPAFKRAFAAQYAVHEAANAA